MLMWEDGPRLLHRGGVNGFLFAGFQILFNVQLNETLLAFYSFAMTRLLHQRPLERRALTLDLGQEQDCCFHPRSTIPSS